MPENDRLSSLQFFKSLTIDQQLYVLEIALQALIDPAMYERVADILDLADSEVKPLLERLRKWANEDTEQDAKEEYAKQ